MTDRIYGLTDTGRARSNNEDAFIAQLSNDGKYIIACVIDGVGGYSGGEVAAALAREVILAQLDRTEGDLLSALVSCFQLANKKIIEQKKQVREYESMACVATLALIDLKNNEFYYVHVGDTRLYLLRDGSLIKITHDQSFVGYLEESSRISEQEAMTHPKRNEINKALGFDGGMDQDDQYIETGRSPFLPGDRILLCSDGLTDMVAVAEINKVLISTEPLHKQCERLVAIANEKGGVDNITVVIAANDKEPVRYDATRPATDRHVKQPSVDSEIINERSNVSVKQEHPSPDGSAPKTWLVTVASLTFILLAGNVWQFLNNKQHVIVSAEALTTKESPTPHPSQTKLENSIAGLTGNLLLLNDSIYTTPIVINRPIKVDHDTLFIKGKGNIVFIADSGYNGAAFNLSPNCKMILLDSVLIKGFETGIIAYNNSLLLKNVRFEDCKVSVQNLMTQSGSSGNSRLTKSDSITLNP